MERKHLSEKKVVYVRCTAPLRSVRTTIGAFVIGSGLAIMSPGTSEAVQVVQGVDVKVTLDNNNVDAGFATPSFDGRNSQQNETSVAISPVNPNVVAIASNDLRLFNFFAGGAGTTSNWMGLNVSVDAGATWFNTMIPGFPADTSPAGLASPVKGMQGQSDPTIRFDADGNLYVSALAFVSQPVPGVTPVPDNMVFVAKYLYTPGSPGGLSTPNSAANPPDFTYDFTTIAGRGARFNLPDPAFFRTGKQPGRLEDKPWMALDTNASSPCFRNIYVAWNGFTGNAGAIPVLLSRSTDGGVTFSQPVQISQKGQEGSQSTEGSNLTVGSDGRIYVSYRAFGSNPSDPPTHIDIARSRDCGKHFETPVTAAAGFSPMRGVETGLSFRTPTFAGIATDDTEPDTVYVAYMAKTGNPANADIFVVRSPDGGDTWEAPVKVNDDSTSKHQFFPTIAVSNGVLHVAWYDLRDSPNPDNPAETNDVLNVYYASSNTSGIPYPAFSPNFRVSDVGQQPNCRFGVSGFMGDYIELAARFDGVNHIVHLAWADNRDIPSTKCDLDPASGPSGDRFIGQRNQNVYADRLVVAP